MRRERHHVAAASYEVGYRKPPIHSRFKPGTSGNPRGRPRGRPLKRVDAMLVEELYRLVKVVDGETSQQVPVIQAIIRSLMLQAAKGNSPARRAALQLLQAMQGYLDACRPSSSQDALPSSSVSAARSRTAA
jgi:hypothetical protein